MYPRASTAEGSLPRYWRAAFVVTIVGLAVHAAVASGDVVRMLNDHQQAAQARVDLILSAQREIDVACFSVADDRLARAFLALLRDAALRGVRVRLIVDGVVNHIPPSIQRRLLAAGVEVREYHPVQATHPFWLNRRMHDKVLVVDGCRLIVGSRNLDVRNFGLACRNFVDSDAFVCGCAAREASRYFHCLWNSDEVRPVDPDRHGLCPLPRDDGPACPDCALNRALARLVGESFIQTEIAIDWSAGLPPATDVHFLYDPRGQKNQPGAISEQLLELFAGAQESIIVESPYLVFSHKLDAAIAEAQARGVEVVVLTNSLASTDQTLVYAGYANQKRRLLARGVEFWEYAGPDHFHAKSALVDGCLSMIGSYNFDPRSERLNTETAIASSDACVADALIESMAEHFANAWQIGPDGQPLGANVRHPGAPPQKIRQYRAARLLAPLIKRHL